MAEPPREADVLIVGAGPAGLSAAAELRRLGVARVLVLDRDTAPGGVPRISGHSPYGLREFRRPMFGPTYARALAERARGAGAEILTGTTVTALHPGPRVSVTSDAGTAEIAAQLVLLATGVRETSRAGRLVGGTKPGGVMTTGALQGLVYGAGRRPFRRPVVIGSELVAFSALLTCRHAGIRPAAMVEPGARITARHPAEGLPWLLGIPLLLETELISIEGRDRVEGVVLAAGGAERRVETDGVIFTGRFRPEAALIRESHLVLDPATGGPEIDEYGRSSDPAVFAAGNLLRPVETAGWCWEEGRAVARAMARALAGGLPPPSSRRIAATGGIAWALPQRIAGGPDPAIDQLQLRVAEAAAGRLSLRADGQELAGRTLRALPERRLLLPLPPAAHAAEVALETGP
jgi:NADPH-dependent 2,4-dienoyl-CoA reductase/sulfur reductase-like enzyme